MRVRLFLGISLALWITSAAFGCSCENSIPIQKTLQSYRDQAVFTAHITKASDGRIQAKIVKVFWGVPSDWHGEVTLDTSYPCDIDMTAGEDYLVAGPRIADRVFRVAGCTRTQPLNYAQVDLRTLDGHICSAPGGTLIGRVLDEENRPVPNQSITFRDLGERKYSGTSDSDGVFVIKHVAQGPVILESNVGRADLYVAVADGLSGDSEAKTGVCIESNVVLKGFQLSGRVPAFAEEFINVELEPIGSPETVERGTVTADAHFYFSGVKPGTYRLALVVHDSVKQLPPVYFPGTSERDKARLISLAAQPAANSYDFDLAALPLVKIPVKLDTKANSRRRIWSYTLSNSEGVSIAEAQAGVAPEDFLYGLQGEAYELTVSAWKTLEDDNAECTSLPLSITAQPGMAPVHIVAACK